MDGEFGPATRSPRLAPPSQVQSVHRDLWSQALERFPHDKQLRLTLKDCSSGVKPDSLLEEIAKNRHESEEKQWKYVKASGQVIYIRDILHNVATWIRNFRDVGDVVVQYDPAHLALPWAGVRLLLQLATNDDDLYGAILDGVELVSMCTFRYAKVEELYLVEYSAQTGLLKEHLEALYAAILIFLSRAIRYYKQNSFKRTARGILRGASSVDKLTQSIIKRASRVDETASLIDAEFARKMARCMQNGLQSIHDHFDNLDHKLDAIYSGLKKLHLATKIECTHILGWIDPTYTEEEYDNAIQSQSPGTCQWLLQRPQFVEWMQNENSIDNQLKFFWLHGPPGFGKTVLCAYVVQCLKRDSPSSVASFFCASSNAAKRQPLAIVRSWVAQLILEQSQALDIATQLYHRKMGQPLTSRDMWQLFKQICEQLRRCFLIVDGFDECIKDSQDSKISTRDGAASFLEDLVEALSKIPAQVLIVSREDSDVREQVRKMSKEIALSVSSYEIRTADTREDVHLYTQSLVLENLSTKSDHVRKEISKEASERSQGMFLWIRLLGTRLRRSKNAKQLQELIKRTPEGLDLQYERELHRIKSLDEDEKDRTFSIIRWVLLALTPLTVRELTEALAVDLEASGDVYPRCNLPDTWDEAEVNDEIRRLCGSLIEIRGGKEDRGPEDQKVYFVHASVRDYLFKTLIGINGPESPDSKLALAREHSMLAQICLRYLSCANAEYQSDISTGVRWQASAYRFLPYAAASWHLHAKEVTDQLDSMLGEIDRFFDSKATRWLLWSEFIDATTMSAGESYVVPCPEFTPRRALPLFYLCLLDLEDWACHYMDHEVAECISGSRNTCLHAASARGCFKACKALIASGCDVTGENGSGWTPLHFAAEHGQLGIAQLLIEKGVDINSQSATGRSPLEIACGRGCYDIVKLLIGHGADPNMPTKTGNRALHQAAESGHYEIVRTLIENWADINVTSEDGSTPLHEAARWGHLRVLQTLLEFGANINKTTVEGYTPLHNGVLYGHFEIVQSLLINSAEVDPRLTDGYTPLHLAMEDGYVEIVRLLLDQNASIESVEKDGYTPLAFAAARGHIEAVKLLIDRGANIHSITDMGSTVLRLAARTGNTDVARILITNGASISKAANNGCPLLCDVVKDGLLDMVQLLIENGAGVDDVDNDCRPPLFIASIHHRFEIARLLLEHNAEVDKPTCRGFDTLHNAAKHGNVDLAALLLDHGAYIDKVNDAGHSPLHTAAEFGQSEMVRWLLDHGACINKTTNSGHSALHLAAQKGQLETTRLLLDRGAWARTSTITGVSVLHSVVVFGQLEVARVLLVYQLNDRQNPDGSCANIGSAIAEQHPCDVQDPLGFTPLLLALKHRREDIVALFAEFGANFCIIGGYGRAASDELATNELLSRRVRDIGAVLEATPPDQKRYMLRKTIKVIAQRLLGHEPYKDAYENDFNVLGHCLIFSERINDAIISFQQAIQGWNSAGKPFRKAYCDGPHCQDTDSDEADCENTGYESAASNSADPKSADDNPPECDRNSKEPKVDNPEVCNVDDNEIDSNSECTPPDCIVGLRYVCKSCVNVDLCHTCMRQYRIESALPAVPSCRNHPFLKVPCPEDRSTDLYNKAIPETIQPWLRRLLDEYEEDESQR